MSISFRQIRKNSTAQGRFKDLVQDYQRSLAESVTVDNPDFRVKMRTMYSKMTYKDPFTTHKTKPVTTVFYLPFEPDAKYNVGLWNLDHNGRFCIDSSGRGHVGRWIRNPDVKEGIDNGFGTSLYADFDGEWTHAYIDDKPDLRLSFSPYFSISGRIYPTSIDASDGSMKYRTILQKTDSITASVPGGVNTGHVGNGFTLAVLPDGKLRFTMLSAGIPYSVETLPNVIIPSNPPTNYDFTITCNQVDKRTIPVQEVEDVSDVPGADPELYPAYDFPLIAPRIEISVNSIFYAIYTANHLDFVDDSYLRLRFGTAYSFVGASNHMWYRWKGGIQRIAFYRRVLTMREIQYLAYNRMTISEIPFGNTALAGSTIVLPTGVEGFGGYDPLGFDTTGFDTTPVTDQSTLQGGGFDPRGMDSTGFETLPQSQS